MPNVGDIIRAEDLQDLLEQINSNSSNIVGELKYLTYNQIPENCLMCDGSELSRDIYSELFAVIGTTYGEGDGSTTFNIPDYRGAFLRCIGGNADELGVLQEDATDVNGLVITLQRSRTNSIVGVNSGNNRMPLNINGSSTSYYPVIADNISDTFTSTDIETRPSNYAINICIIFE